MEGSTEVRSWLRCYRCWSQNLEVQVHYEGIHRIDPESGERGEVVDEMQEAVVQCLECMHDQPHLGFHNGRVEPIEDRWERMIAGTPWVASCTVTVDADDVETCSGPEAGDALSYAAFGDHGTREFFTHVRFHKHDEDRIVVHLLVELYARSAEEATEVLEEAARGYAGDHLARRGVAAAGVDRRRPALRTALDARSWTVPLHAERFPGNHEWSVQWPRAGCVLNPLVHLHHDQRQRHRHRGRELVDDQEQQIEHRCQHERQQRRSALPAGVGGQDRPQQPSDEQVAIAHRNGPEDLALQAAGDRPPGCAATSVALGACSRSETTSQASAPAISTIPSFSQLGGVTAASSTPRVTQLSADSSAPAASPAQRGPGGPGDARTEPGLAGTATSRAPRIAQPSAAAASSGTATSAR